MPIKEYDSIHELYLDYRYLWRDINSRDIRRPYVSIDKISDHPFALSIQEWRKVIDTYLDELFEELMKGYAVFLPWEMGCLQMCKYKPKRKRLYRDKEGKLTRKFYKNRHTGGYSPLLVWTRRLKCNMKFKFIHKLKMTAHRKRWISKKLMETPEIIYNLPDRGLMY